MASGLPLQFLRPYAFAPATYKYAVYSRFFTAANRVTRTTVTGSSRLLHISAVVRKNKSSEVTNAAAVESGSHGELDGHAKEVERRVQKLKEYDVYRYPRLINPDNRVAIDDFLDRHKPGEDTSDQTVTFQGRITAIRRSGSKLVFLDIVQNFNKAQVKVNMAHLNIEDVAIFKRALHPFLKGDFISVAGTPEITDDGDLILKAAELPSILAPGLAPIPAKLTDDETKIQNRHVDLLVNKRTSDVLRLRSHVIQTIRDFLRNRHFMEVSTPILASYAGGAAARPFLTSATEFPEKQLSMRIAPELWLKRLVVGGMDRVFEIGPSFRNEGLDTTHNAEFTMCEFYTAYAGLDELITMTESLIRDLYHMASRQVETKQLPTLELPQIGQNDFKFKRLEFIPELERRLNTRFPDLSHPDAFPNLLQRLYESKTVTQDQTILEDIFAQPSLNKVLDHLASTFLEPDSESEALFITNHPACMSPLAKSFTCPKTQQILSARAELFIQGREIANMYEEENDPVEQKRKFVEQVEAKKARKLAEAEAEAGVEAEEDAVEWDADEEGDAVVDESYVRALEYGLPPTGGWGCGVDRLVMMLSGAGRISDVQYFGNLRNVVSLTQQGKQ